MMTMFLNHKRYLLLFFSFFFFIGINAQEKKSVEWKDKKGVEEKENNSGKKELKKETQTGVNSSSAKSENVLKPEEDGEVQFTIADLQSSFMIGLTPENKEQKYEVIAFAIHINDDLLSVFEDGEYIGSYGTVSIDDSIIIRREANTIRYLKNGLELRNIPTDNKYSLIIDVSMIKEDSKVAEVKASFGKKLSAFAYISHIGQEDSIGIIDVNVTGGSPPYTYDWGENSPQTKYINNLPAGIYSVKITDTKGQELLKKFEVKYQLAFMTTGSFLKNNDGYLEKNSNAETPYELIRGSNPLPTSGEQSFITSFSGEEMLFFVGIDESKDNTDAMNVDYGVFAKGKVLYVMSKGKVLSKIGEYQSDSDIKLIKKETSYVIEVNGKSLHHYTVKENVEMYPKVAFGYGTTMKKGLGSRPWRPWRRKTTKYYATLTKELDGSHYVMTNDIKFKYDEKYNDESFEYTIYDWERNPVLTQANVSPNNNYGVNYHRLYPINSYLNDDEFYVLETINSKGEKYMMRFQYDYIPIIIIADPPPPPYVDGIKDCCYPRPGQCCQSVYVPVGGVEVSDGLNNDR